MYQGLTGRLPAESPRVGRPAGWSTSRTPGWRPVSSNALLDGARPDDGSRGNYRGPSEAISDQAKYTGGEQKAHVTHRGNADDLLVRSEYTGHDEVVGARDDR